MEKEGLTGAHQLPAQTLFSDGSLRKSGRRVAAVNRDRLDGSKFQPPCHSQWDDEQIAIWLNSQLDPAMLTPMGVAGYRVDVRNPGTLELHSLSRGQGDVLLGDMNLGEFNDEFAVEAAPLQLAGKKDGRLLASLLLHDLERLLARAPHRNLSEAGQTRARPRCEAVLRCILSLQLVSCLV